LIEELEGEETQSAEEQIRAARDAACSLDVPSSREARADEEGEIRAKG
jgi:hypothetical protein